MSEAPRPTAGELAALLELSGRASPGPWTTEDYGKGPFVTTVEDEPCWICDFGSAQQADGDFIALSRNLLPAIATEVLALREALARLAAQARYYADSWEASDMSEELRQALPVFTRDMRDLGAMLDGAVSQEPPVLALDFERSVLPPGMLPSEEPSTTASDRSVEMQWIRDHSDELAALPPGEWVAIDGAELIAHGPYLAAVLNECVEKGHPDPFITGTLEHPGVAFYG